MEAEDFLPPFIFQQLLPLDGRNYFISSLSNIFHARLPKEIKREIINDSQFYDTHIQP